MAAYQLSETGYGLALRDVLRAAIGQLRPLEEVEDPYAKSWRHYLILYRQYINGRSAGYLAEQLGIARSTYNAAQAAALDQLARILTNWEHGGSFAGTWRLPRLASSDAVLPAVNAQQLPPTGLVGRKRLIDELRQALIEGKDIALYGPPGIGKSALASALAHNEELRRHFRDGVLWAGLGKEARGLAQTTKWAVQLGLPLNELSDLEDIREREIIINNALAGRRLLLVMDDVWEAEAALALKISGPNCAHLYTTRSPSVAKQLAGDKNVELAGLIQGEAVSLLRHFVPDMSLTSVSLLAQSVRGNPLNLVVLGKFIKNELQSGQNERLEEAIRQLDGDQEQSQGWSPDSDARISLEKVLKPSLETLRPHVRKVFAGLALFPPKPNTFSGHAALEIAGASPHTLQTLVDQGLLETTASDRYTMQRSVRESILGSEGNQQVAERFLDYFLGFIETNQSDYVVIEKDVRNIISALNIAHEMGKVDDLIRGSNALFPQLEVLGLLDGASEILSRAERTARSGDNWLDTVANLGRLANHREKYDQAEACYAQSLDLAQEHKDIGAECAMLRGLGVVAFRRGDSAAAQTNFQMGLRLARKKAASHHVIDLNIDIGSLYLSQDDFKQAEKHFQRGLNWARKAKNNVRMRAMLVNLGDLALRKDEYERAGEYYNESLALSRAAGDEKWIGDLSLKLGTLASDQGDDQKADDYFRDALAIAKKWGDHAQVALLQGNLGVLAVNREDFFTAKVLLEAGLNLARLIRHREHTIHLLINLGSLHQKQGTISEARGIFEEALSLAQGTEHQDFINIIMDMLAELK
jgi:tetratricopeptide (TPR) repeat protein